MYKNCLPLAATRRMDCYSNNNNNGYFYVLFLQRAHSPFIKNKNKIKCDLFVKLLLPFYLGVSLCK